MTETWNESPEFERGQSLYREINSDSRRMFWSSDAEYVKIVLELRECLRGRRLFGMSQVESGAVRAAFHALRMSRHFREVSPSEAHLFFPVLDRINGNIKAELDRKRGFPGGEHILPLSHVRGRMADMVGLKAARMSEASERLEFSVPDGFVITTAAFELVLHQGTLMEDINKIRMEMLPDDLESIRMAGEDIRKLLLDAPLPKALEEALESTALQFVGQLKSSSESQVSLALRSSLAGLEEGLAHPGICPPVLNVSAAEISRAYREVISGLYTPEAIVYRLLHGIRDEDLAMAVVCQPMLDAVAGGTIYTRHPFDMNQSGFFLAAVRGSSWPLFRGTSIPDVYVVSRSKISDSPESVIARKTHQMVRRGDSMARVEIPESEWNLPVLNDLQVDILYQLASQAEEYFQGPQELEWLLDESGFFWVMQVRPLQMFAAPPKVVASATGLKQEAPFGARGNTLAPGLAFGQLQREETEPDCQNINPERILNVLEPETALIQALPWVRGLVVHGGSIFCHLAVGAREAGVPMVYIDEMDLPAELRADMILDGGSGRLIPGRLPEAVLLDTDQRMNLVGTPVHRTLRRVLELIEAESATIPNTFQHDLSECRTLHQVVRFLRDFSFREVLQSSGLILLGAQTKAELMPVGLDRHLCVLSLEDAHGRESEANAGALNPADQGLLLHSLLRGVDAGAEACRDLSFVEKLGALPNKLPGLKTLAPMGYVFSHGNSLFLCSKMASRFAVLQACFSDAEKKFGIMVVFENAPAHASVAGAVTFLQRALTELNFVVKSVDDRIAAAFIGYQSESIQERLRVLGGLFALLHRN